MIRFTLPEITKSDRTPVILNSTFLEISAFSYPNTTSSALKSSASCIVDTTPLHPKNWFTVLEVYVIVLSPDITVPLLGNPIVESTEITSDPTATGSSTLVLPGIVNIPSIKSLSLKPTNNEIL